MLSGILFKIITKFLSYSDVMFLLGRLKDWKSDQLNFELKEKEV